jgi:hypothetical protein
MKMPFGKHKGEDLTDIPIHYLKWIEELDLQNNFDLRSAINHEIERREGDRSSLGYEKPKGKINLKYDKT